MEHRKGRAFEGRSTLRKLDSNSPQEAWAAVGSTIEAKVQELYRNRRSLHINVVELKAAIITVQFFAQLKEHVSHKVDSPVIYGYLSKEGGRIASLNGLVLPFFRWRMK